MPPQHRRAPNQFPLGQQRRYRHPNILTIEEGPLMAPRFIAYSRSAPRKSTRVADQATALVSVLEILLKTELMPVATPFVAVIAPNAIRAATSAYSIRSWPDSSRIRLFKVMTVMVGYSRSRLRQGSQNRRL